MMMVGQSGVLVVLALLCAAASASPLVSSSSSSSTDVSCVFIADAADVDFGALPRGTARHMMNGGATAILVSPAPCPSHPSGAWRLALPAHAVPFLARVRSQAEVASTMAALEEAAASSQDGGWLRYATLVDRTRGIFLLAVEAAAVDNGSGMHTATKRLHLDLEVLVPSTAASTLPRTPPVSPSMVKRRALRNKAKDAVVNKVTAELWSSYDKQLSGKLPLTFPSTKKDNTNGTNVSGAKGGKQVTIHTRNTFAPQNAVAADYLDAQLTAWGYRTFRQKFTVGKAETVNVCGEKRGISKPNEIALMGAHYDSISQDPLTLAPGAVDDGSGCAAVLLAARLLKDKEMARTIHFCFFSGEEQGLYGSIHYVETMKANKFNLIGAFLMDMIAFMKPKKGQFGVTIEGEKDYEALMKLAQANFFEYASDDFVVHLSYDSFGSDHVPFQNAGIPAVLAIERDDTDYPEYHTTKDNYSEATPELARDIAKGVLATIWDLSEFN